MLTLTIPCSILKSQATQVLKLSGLLVIQFGQCILPCSLTEACGSNCGIIGFSHMTQILVLNGTNDLQ